jgi:D-alanine-D-alanine ligase
MNIGIAFTAKTIMKKTLSDRGLSVEDDVLEEYDKLETIEAIETALHDLGHQTCRLWWGEPLIEELKAKRDWLQLVFNISEGFGGRSREAQVPALLEMLGIPYVGSDAMALAVSLDKHATKAMARTAGVTIAKGGIIRPNGEPYTAARIAGFRLRQNLDYPMIVKPAYEGSSKGIRANALANKDDHDLAEKVNGVHVQYNQPALVEEFIWGREVTVGVVGAPLRILGIMEIRHRSGDPFAIYSLEAKRNWQEQVEYICNPKMPTEVLNSISEQSLAACEALGVRDVARVDFRLRGTSMEPVFLEINPLPGLNAENSDLCLLAQGLGVSYRDLIGHIIEGAVARTSVNAKAA